ncbi:hypothetical protein D3C86_1219860 [compost metagenome]
MDNSHYSYEKTKYGPDKSHPGAFSQVNQGAKQNRENPDDDTEHAQEKQLVLVVESECLGELIVLDIGIAVQICEERNDRKLVVANQKQTDDTNYETYCRKRSHELFCV